MKNIALLFVFFGSILLVAAFWVDNMEENLPEDIETRLNTTTESIRASNIGVQMRVVSEGLFDVDLFTVKGSGVVFKADDDYYYALTNCHVVNAYGEGTPHYSVSLPEHEAMFEAETVVMDAKTDLAVIRFAKNGLDIPLMDIHTRLNTTIEKDEPVLAVGDADTIEASVSRGQFTAMQHADDLDEFVIRHSAQLHHGYSGGALTDIEGNLIGINTRGKTAGAPDGLAIPLNVIHAFLEDTQMKPTIVEP